MGQKAIEAYIQKVMSLREQEQVLSTQYLESLAIEVGLDEEDLQRVRSLVEQLYTQALSFIDFGNIEDALKNLEQIVVLAPDHFEAYYLMAICYYEKGKKSTHNHDLNKAKDYLRQCLQMQPTNTRAIALLSNIKAAEKRYQKKSMWLFWGIILLSGIVFYFVAQEAQNPSLPNNKDLPLKEESSTSQEETQSEPVKSKNSVELLLVEDPAAQGLTFIPYKQEYNCYEGTKSYSVKIEGYLKLVDVEVSELDIQLQALDAQGEVLEIRSQTVLRRSDQMLRSGDMVPLALLIYKDKVNDFPKIAKARLSYQNVQATRIPNIR
jgi:tetratricopeptide (TPR) repeat protein